MGNPVTWFEINSKKAEALHEFYKQVFGWQLKPLEGAGYALVDTGAKNGISGGIGEAQGPNQVIFYVQVDDPETVLQRIERLGGKAVVPVTVVPEMVTFAQFADPQGNVIGLVKSSA